MTGMRWRVLDDDDISEILGADGRLRHRLTRKARQVLKSKINRELERGNKDDSSKEPTSSDYRRQLQRIQNATRELEAAWLGCPPADRNFAMVVDRLRGTVMKGPASVEALRVEYPQCEDDGVLLLASRAGVVVPTGAAKVEVVNARHYLKQLGRWAHLAEFLEVERSKNGGPGDRNSKAHHYDCEYELILKLGVIYEGTFGERPKATRDGPWCSFLAGVLSRSEGKPSDSARALRRWRRALQWQRDNADAGLALLRRGAA